MVKFTGHKTKTSHAAMGLFATLAALALLALPTSALATGDANTASCPFETEASPGFRTFLPDCRAYELVTPTYDGGAQPQLVNVSPEGDRVLVKSPAGFAGIENLEDAEGKDFSDYVLSRTAGGWSAEALRPPTSLFAHENVLTISSDLSRALLEVIPADGSEEVSLEPSYAGWGLAVREATDSGSARYTLLGPALAPGREPGGSTAPGEYAYEVAGASDDLSHVFLTVRAEHRQTWPGDQTVQRDQSVYEYRDIAGSEPVLVGVRNEGKAPWAPDASHLNEGAQLVSQCGTAFRGSSADGETVFFEALHIEGCTGVQPSHVSELYARVGGSRTIKLSGSEPAQFQGVSEDGTQAFFTEAGKLYEYGIAAERAVLLASGVASVQVISRDGGRVYFTSPEVLTSAPNGNGETAEQALKAGASDPLYVYDTEPGHTGLAFVAGEAGQLQTTADGEYLAFFATMHLLGTGDRSAVRQLFEYDAQTTRVVRVSIGQQSPGGSYCSVTNLVEPGYDCNGNTTDRNDEPYVQTFEGLSIEHQSDPSFLGTAASPEAVGSGRDLAEDGTVVFASYLPLTPQATPGHGEGRGDVNNAYEYRDGQVYLLSPALYPKNHGFQLPMIDESGSDVFLTSAEGLVPQATGSGAAVYDARREGGFPAPTLAPSCSGEACQGPSPRAPAFAAPASNTLTGSGNLPAPVVAPAPAMTTTKTAKCKKGFTKKKDKCVKNKKKKTKAKKASNDRRGS